MIIEEIRKKLGLSKPTTKEKRAMKEISKLPLKIRNKLFEKVIKEILDEEKK